MTRSRVTDPRPVAAVTGLGLVWLIAGVAIAATWLASVLTRDSSWVDRIWSIVPVAYLWVFAATSGLGCPGWSWSPCW